jgi:hypothetical protein
VCRWASGTYQFLRAVFRLPPGAVRSGANQLVVSFNASLELDGRFMPCTG